MQLEKEFKFYLSNKKELNKKYNGKFIIIKGDKVMGEYNSEIEAYQDGEKKFGLGKFLIQLCSLTEETPQVFHSRVYF